MRSLIVAIGALLAGCGGGSDALTVAVFKPRGSLQCEPGSGRTIDELRRQLVDAGIEVSSSACGTDGLSHPAVCGTPDGAIGVFEIPLTQVEAAAALLFAPLSTLSSARIVPCT